MSFYNRLLAQPVGTFVDLLGKSRPLDVTPMGGLNRISAAVNSNTQVQVLPAASSGFVYRLHRYGIQQTQGVPAFTVRVMQISDSGAIDADLYMMPATTTVVAGGKDLGGILSSGPVNVFQISGNATMFVVYDLVIAPTIQ